MPAKLDAYWDLGYNGIGMPIPGEVDAMGKHFVQLCPDVTRAHVAAIGEWLQDIQVHRYLSDSRQAAADLEQLLERVDLPSLSHIFGQDGRFLMICSHDDRPIGFVRLIQCDGETELVIVIGDRSCWGRHYGRQAVQASLRTAFYEMRSERVVARIHHENERSLRIFSHLGFRIECQAEGIVRMTMTMDEYLRLARTMPAHGSEILLTLHDRERLLRWIDHPRKNPPSGHSRTVGILAAEIERAIIVDSRELPRDVISMNSRATLSIDDKELTLSLAFPDAADWSQRRLSILSPVGTAILGYRTGDRFNWRFAAGLANIQVQQLLYQPEAAGHFDL